MKCKLPLGTLVETRSTSQNREIIDYLIGHDVRNPENYLGTSNGPIGRSDQDIIIYMTTTGRGGYSNVISFEEFVALRDSKEHVVIDSYEIC